MVETTMQTSTNETSPLQMTLHVATPLWDKCENETHIPKSGKLKSSRTPKTLELDFRGQNTSHWDVLYVIEKVLKFRCPKWPRMSHLDIFSPSYGQKKGRESNCQFDSRPLKVGNRPESDVWRWSKTWRWKALKSEVWAKSYRCPKSWECKPGQFRDSSLGVPGKSVIRM
jgi:hypothetical protein